MRLIVFGPTGRSGLAVLERASQDSGIPKKVSDKLKKDIKIIIGDVTNVDQVADALKDQDVVISCLGTGYSLGATTVISEGLRNILNGMRKQGLKQITIIGVSTLMPNQPAEPFFLKKVIADHRKAYDIMKQYKDINWVCMAPPEIADLSYTGTCKATINKINTQVVTTHDMADWMLQCSKNPEMAKEHAHQLVGISSTLGTFTWLFQTGAGLMSFFAAVLLIGGCYFAYQKFS